MELYNGKKYSLTENTKMIGDRVLFQIESKVWVNMGDGCVLTKRGGFIESEYNLSHDGDSWVDVDCCVYGDARVEGDALVTSDEENNPSIVYGKTLVKDNATVIGSILKGRKVIDGTKVMRLNKLHK